MTDKNKTFRYQMVFNTHGFKITIEKGSLETDFVKISIS